MMKGDVTDLKAQGQGKELQRITILDAALTLAFGRGI
jgi:hypothetical protein